MYIEKSSVFLGYGYFHLSREEPPILKAMATLEDIERKIITLVATHTKL